MTMRTHSPRSSIHIAAAMLLLCGTAGSLMAQAPARFGREGSIKVRLPRSMVTPRLLASGAVLVAEYESFAIVEMPARALPADDRIEALTDENRILLNAGALDTTTPAVKALQQPRAQFEGRAMHLVQFAGPVQPAWLDQLTRTGVEIITYIPSNTYIVYGDAQQLAALQALAAADAHIQWNGAYLDQYRLDPTAVDLMNDAKHAAATNQLFAIQLVQDAQANKQTLAVIETLRTGPVVRSEPALNYYNVIAPIPPVLLGTIAARPDVVSIQPYSMPVLFDERQDQIVAGSLIGNLPTGPGYLAWLTSKGFTQAQFTASGFCVDVSDSGIDNATTSPNHFGLYASGIRPGISRIVYNRLVGTAHAGSTLQGCDGHGNLNTHIVLGYNTLVGFPHTDASGYHYGLGVCPFTYAGSSVIFDPTSFTSPNYENLQSMAYNNGARISTNSWGNTSGNTYSADSQRYDALVRDAQPTGSTNAAAGNQEMCIIFAAGNSGSGSNTVHPPATGKNLITCAAAENVQAFGGSDGCGEPDTLADSANDIATFSSRGPCSDTRKKPDISAPGVHISGGVAQTASPGVNGTHNACYNGVQVCGGVGSIYYPPGQEWYTASSGTSHSTPCVAGGAALVRQFFINQTGAPPSPAMTKAFLMNSARYMTGAGANDTLYSNNQGMGEMNLGEAFDRIAGTPTFVRDEVAADMFTATGQVRSWNGTVATAAKPVRVTLAWTDAPGATTGSAAKNNLDLTVTIGANTYKGNVFTGANSVTGGAADTLNNVESVFIPAGATGAITVNVTAASINSDGVPNVGGALDQDFALVVYNSNGMGGIITGACCIPSTLSCAVLSSSACTAQGGVYAGDNVTCAVANCPSPGACCIPSTLSCALTTPAACAAQGGSYFGNSTTCAAANCPTPGACCKPDGTCVQSTPAACTAASGVYHGNGTACGSIASAGSGQTFASTNVPVAIVDLGTVTSTLSVPANFPVFKVTANLTLTHTFDSDLILSLIGPGGSPTVVLAANVGGSGDNFTNTTFDDAAATPIASGTPPFTGTFQPSSPLSAMQGIPSSGTWTLQIQDVAAADVGTLLAWSITLTPGAFAGCSSTCYPNCDGSTTAPALNVLDFACFLNRYAAGDTYANCDNSTTPPVLNVLDFACFLNSYATGCS